jgi:regulator of sigma E protease
VIVFMVVSTIAYTTPTYSNRIVLLSEYDIGSAKLSSYPADRAGLKTGDRILEADGKEINDFSDLLQEITLSANKSVDLKIERNGSVIEKSVTPMLDKDTGAGLLGVTYWADPIVGEISKGSAAQIAGLEAGDRIVSLNGKNVRHAVEFLSILNVDKPERVKIGIERAGAPLELSAVLSWSDQGKSNLGLRFQTQTHSVRPATSFSGAVNAGFAETLSTFNATCKGLASLVQGVNLLKALSGPARITYMVGQSATEGIQNSGSGGLAVPLSFLAFLSIGLFIMNLLPIPALDGGQILMFLVEAIRKRAMRPITIYRYQAIGATFILALLVIATVGDFLFFAAK